MTNQSILAAHRPPTLPSPAFQSQVRRAPDFLCPDGIVFPSLEAVVQRHLFQLRTLDKEHPRPPRFLLISGKPGTGKTVAATDAALRFKCAVLQLPAHKLASDSEGGASAILEGFLQDAVRHSQIHKEQVVIVGDDFDLGIVSIGKETGHTVNSKLLIQQLQALADADGIIDYAGNRIGLILTGNDWSSVRSSLFRDGRAAWHTHEPTPDEVHALVMHLFRPRSTDDRRLLEKLVRRYRSESLAFWGAIKSELGQDQIDDLIRSGVTDTNTLKLELSRYQPLPPGRLLKIARAHAKTRRLSFL